MGFQPFGYRFEVCSSSNPDDVKSAIRAKKKTIFDPKNGARGWIAGPLLCLWFTGLDSRGPMLFGFISKDGSGTRVSGRAGSDLNGVLGFALLIPAMAFLVFQMVSQDQASLRQLLVIGFVFLAGGPLVFWFAHKDRRDAEPLVRFLQKEIGTPKSKAPKSPHLRMRTGLKLSANDQGSSVPLSADAIRDALLQTGTNDVVILEAAPEDYVQTIGRDGGFVVEQRKGSASQHFGAWRRDGTFGGSESEILSFDDAVAVFTAFGAGTQMPTSLIWKPVDLNR